MTSNDLQNAIDWLKRPTKDPSPTPTSKITWVPIFLILLLLALAGWWWWVTYGNREKNRTDSSLVLNDLKQGGATKVPTNRLIVKPNGNVISG